MVGFYCRPRNAVPIHCTLFHANYPLISPAPISGALTFNIECSREKAASLILPNGATRMDIYDEKLGPFLSLALRHGASWLGLSFTSLCLVTGCVKTNSWALMSLYSSSNRGGLSLKFGVTGAGPSWTWLVTGPADTRKSRDMGDLNRNDCVFLRGYRISKRNRLRYSPKGGKVRVLRIPEKRGGNSAFGRTHLTPTSSGSNFGGQQVDDGQGSNHGAGQAASWKLSQNVDGDNTDLKTASSPDIGTEDDDDIVIEPLAEVLAVSLSSLFVWVRLIWIFSQTTHQKLLTNVFSVKYVL